MTSQGTTQATTTTRGPGAALRIVGIAFVIFGVVTLLVDATQVGNHWHRIANRSHHRRCPSRRRILHWLPEALTCSRSIEA
jgi:hypothetical protein